MVYQLFTVVVDYDCHYHNHNYSILIADAFVVMVMCHSLLMCYLRCYLIINWLISTNYSVTIL